MLATGIAVSCLRCGADFRVYPSRIKDGRGRYCSHRCKSIVAAAIAVSRRPSIEERFWRQVDMRGPDECWPWLGHKNKQGYGRVLRSGEYRPAHQVAWEIANGAIFPRGKFGCHSCDNPSCANPAHIWPGTNMENIADSMAKGRRVRIKIGGVCRRGHALSETSLSSAGGRARCRECQKIYWTTGNKKRQSGSPALMTAPERVAA